MMFEICVDMFNWAPYFTQYVLRNDLFATLHTTAFHHDISTFDIIEMEFLVNLNYYVHIAMFLTCRFVS